MREHVLEKLVAEWVKRIGALSDDGTIDDAVVLGFSVKGFTSGHSAASLDVLKTRRERIADLVVRACVTQHITELCLVTEAGSVPFAVLIEQGEHCAMATAADFGDRIHEPWAGHVLEAKERRPQEWWVLAAARLSVRDCARSARAA